MTEPTTAEAFTPPTIEPVSFDDDYIDHPFIPSRKPEDVKAFFQAFAKAQGGYKAVVREIEVKITPKMRDGYQAPAYTFKYAELANVIEATKSLAQNGITVSQPVHEDRAGKMWLYTIVAHESGAGLVTRLKLYGDKDLKVFGGEITYLRRYCFAPAIGVASEDDADSGDDGRGGGNDMRGDEGGYTRERDEAPAPTPSPQRRARPAAQQQAAPAGEDAAPSGKPASKATDGAVKNLQGKIAALEMVDVDLKDMLDNLGVKAVAPGMSLADWTAVRNEVDRRMKAG